MIGIFPPNHRKLPNRIFLRILTYTYLHIPTYTISGEHKIKVWHRKLCELIIPLRHWDWKSKRYRKELPRTYLWGNNCGENYLSPICWAQLKYKEFLHSCGDKLPSIHFIFWDWNTRTQWASFANPMYISFHMYPGGRCVATHSIVLDKEGIESRR